MTQQPLFNPVGWFEIYVDNMNRAKEFYEGVFNTTLSKIDTPDHVEMWGFNGVDNVYGVKGALVKMSGVSAGGQNVIIYFTCPDCKNEESRVVACGGKVEKEKFQIGEYGFISLVRDTEGNMIGLHSCKG